MSGTAAALVLAHGREITCCHLPRYSIRQTKAEDISGRAEIITEREDGNPSQGEEHVQTMAAAIAEATMERLVPQMNATIEQRVAEAVRTAIPEPPSSSGQTYM